MTEGTVDVVVIGAGPGGEIVAARLADHGKRVVLVARELVGGECSYWACMPSKALLRPAEALEEAERVPGAAEAIRGSLDVRAVRARRHDIIHNLDDSSQLPWLDQHHVELVRGTARLDGERRVRVGERVLVAQDAVVIAVGSGPAMPPIPGLAEASAWSNREITTAREVPGRLAILGGGVVGVEMAQAWSSLGSHVTLIEGAHRLIAREEPIACAEVTEALEQRGVRVLCGGVASEVERSGDTVTIRLEDGTDVRADHLLVAVGRRPHTADLGLESVGLEPGQNVQVDDALRVDGHPWLYAIGDANGRVLLTHQAKYQGRVAAENILGRPARARTDNVGAPRVIFTSPQVAAVGMTSVQAMEAGHRIEVVDIPTSGNAGGSFYGRGASGTTRFVVGVEGEVLLGVTFVGAEVTDFLQAATVAVVARVPLAELAHAVAPFPTRSEIWLGFIEAYERRRDVSLHADGAPVALGSAGEAAA